MEMYMYLPIRHLYGTWQAPLLVAVVLITFMLGCNSHYTRSVSVPPPQRQSLCSDTFELKFSTSGQPQSLRFLPVGEEMLDLENPGDGFKFQPMHRDGTLYGTPQQLSRLSFSPPGHLVAATADGERAVTLAIAEHERHVALRIVDLQGFPSEETVLLSFDINVALSGTAAAPIGNVRDDRRSVGILGLDYMTRTAIAPERDRTNLQAEWGWLWYRSEENPFGGFALYACAAEETLTTIGMVEQAEGLPHPLHNGKWAKIVNGVSRLSQMWFVFDPKNDQETEETLSYFQKSGMRLLYLPQWLWQGPGLYQVKREFWPNGIDDLRAFSDRLRRMGMLLGVHTGSAGIFMRDPVHASPIPDARLASWGSGELEQAVDADDDVLLFRPDPGVEPPKYLTAGRRYTRPPYYPRHWGIGGGYWFQIGNEVVHATAIEESDQPVWRLVGCRRHANGTGASGHTASTAMRGLLVTYGSCYTPAVGSTLFDEATANMSRLVNEARLARISYDALEFSDYLGYWASNKFMLESYGGFDHAVACESSAGVPDYQWHMASYMNVGEGMHYLPKFYFERYLVNNVKVSNNSFLPGALDAFTFRIGAPHHVASSMDEWQWMLSKAAGYDACFFFETALAYFRDHGQTNEILDSVRHWEDARIAGAFTAEQRRRLQEYDMSFRLDASGDHWKITPVRIQTRYALAGDSPVLFENPFGEQPLRFEARVLPAFDYQSEDNLPLLPSDLDSLKIDSNLIVKSLAGHVISGKKERAENAFSSEVTEEDYLRIMGTGSTGASASRDKNTDANIAENNSSRGGSNQVLLLSGTNSGNQPGGALQADWTLPETINLVSHRGIGLWVTGDGNGGYLYFEIALENGMRRHYVVSNDSTARRYVEIPNGEIGCDYRGIWQDDRTWWSTKLGFDYTKIKRISFGLTAIPAGTNVQVKVENPCALAEITVPLVDPIFRAGNATLRIAGAFDTGAYLVYEGGDSAEVLDADRHSLRKVPVNASDWRIETSEACQISVRGTGATLPYVRLLVKPLGKTFEINDPTEQAQALFNEITNPY